MFVGNYYPDYENKDENDGQPDVFDKKLRKLHKECFETLPELLPLM